jgi:PAS domain S-box-containing protein
VASGTSERAGEGPAGPAEERRLRLLLIEDNPGDAGLVRAYLASAGARFELEWAERLAEGIEVLDDRGSAIDAILLDLSLPDSQGFASFESVRGHAPRVPLIILTGLDDEELAVRAVRGGAQDYLPKDQLDGSLLWRTVRYAVERSRADQALRFSEEKLRLAMEASESGIWDFDLRAGTVTASAECQAMLGREPVEATGSLDDAWTTYVHPDDRADTLEALLDTVAGRTPFFERDARLLAEDGEWIWVHGKGSVVERDLRGEAVRVLITGTNITARRLAEQAARENEARFEEQRRIATALQENFIHPLPQIARLEIGRVLETAREAELIGGDFCDVFLVDEAHAAVLIGDVAGKGIGAAGHGETVRAAVRAFATIDSSPAFVLRKTNDLLLRVPQMAVSEFVTASLAVIDLRSGQVTFSSAGHPPAVHSGPSVCTFLDASPGVLLGSFAFDYLDGHVTLAPGDSLVFYTDGVTEARRGDDFFGDSRLVATIAQRRDEAPQALAEGVLAAAMSFAGELRDDLLVLAVRFA